MDMKTFEAFTMKDALKAVKAEFGSNAVIVKTNEKIVEDNKVYEITAAATQREHQVGASAKGGLSELADLRNFSSQVESLSNKLTHVTEDLPSRSQLVSIESCLEEMKTLFFESQRNRSDSLIDSAPLAFKETATQLMMMGISESELGKLIKHITDLPPPSETKEVPQDTQSYYRSQAIRWMIKRIQIAERFTTMARKPNLQAFLGPSGSGKTSLIAKLASQYKRQQSKGRIKIIALEDTKIASTEQLRLYSKILEVEFDTVSSPKDLANHLPRLVDHDLVLIDTGGRSPKNMEKIEDLAEFNTLSVPIDFNLVLSITEKEAQLDRAVRNFSPLGLSSLAFTKLDESWSYGEVFNLNTKWGVPLSYFSTGQRIPDDVERASKERVVERIFGL